MKAQKIETCVCIDHEPDAGDSVYYGMPQLKVCGGGKNQLYEAYCPNCGRGGLFQQKSAYLALRDWNDLMSKLKNSQCFANFIEPGGEQGE